MMTRTRTTRKLHFSYNHQRRLKSRTFTCPTLPNVYPNHPPDSRFPMCSRTIRLSHSVTKKQKWSVAEARPTDSGSYRLTKQESAGRFLGSIRMREIFQFEVWNSSNFVIIFSFIEKSMKKFEINTIDRRYIEKHLEFFSEFFVYIPL